MILLIKGIFFELSKRLTGIEYVKPGSSNQENRKAFRFIHYYLTFKDILLNFDTQHRCGLGFLCCENLIHCSY